MKLSKYKKIIYFFISVFAIVLISAILAYFTDKVTANNSLSIGVVDISINGYSINSQGQKVNWSNNEILVPGTKLSRIAEIKCERYSADCYVRAKVTLKNDSTNEIFSNNLIDIDKNEWLYCKSDGYYYYTKSIAAGSDPIELFRTIEIPKNLDNKYSKNTFSLAIKVDAIQSKHFTPDFSGVVRSPWPGIKESTIKECIYP